MTRYTYYKPVRSDSKALTGHFIGKLVVMFIGTVIGAVMGLYYCQVQIQHMVSSSSYSNQEGH